MTLSPRHLGSHNLGRRDLLLSAGEIVGLVLFPHPRDGVQGGPTVLSLHSSSSTKGTFIPAPTHRQEGGGASTDPGLLLARSCLALSLWTALDELRVLLSVSASPTLTGSLVPKQTQPKDSYPIYPTTRNSESRNIGPSWAVRGL